MFSKIRVNSLSIAMFIGISSNMFITTAKADDFAPGKVISNVAPQVSEVERQLSFWDLPYLEQAFITSSPSNRTDGLSVGQLPGDSDRKEMLVKLAKEVSAGKYGLVDSLLVSHQGKLLFESYFRRARIDLAHGQASATKAYTSLVLGRAIELGYLTMADLNKPLSRFLKNLAPEKFVPGIENITLDKAMTMHSGLRISEQQTKALEQAPDKLKGQGQVQAWFELSTPVTLGSQHYLYQGTDPDMVMQVIDAVVPGTAQEFIKSELLDKLGITNYDWQTAVSGLPEAAWRTSLTSRDMVKLGSLLANNGQWQGEQLISTKFLAKATRGLVKPTQDWVPDNYRYGYFLYQTDINVGQKSFPAHFAWGGGGQFVFAVPALELIVVITGHERESTILEQVVKTIVPAFVG